MDLFLPHPRLPDSPVTTALVSGEYPFLPHALNAIGIKTILTNRESRLPVPVSWHPDMQVCMVAPDLLFTLSGSTLGKSIQKETGLRTKETEKTPFVSYPQDVLCNALILGNCLIANPNTVDPRILTWAKKQEISIIPVRQGYTACAVCIVNKNAVITADRGISIVLEKLGVDVLCIRSGFIRLPGYDTGLFGGCCGHLSRDCIAFTGQLSSHPDCESIRGFLRNYSISILELFPGELMDVGGILPLLQME